MDGVLSKSFSSVGGSTLQVAPPRWVKSMLYDIVVGIPNKIVLFIVLYRAIARERLVNVLVEKVFLTCKMRCLQVWPNDQRIRRWLCNIPDWHLRRNASSSFKQTSQRTPKILDTIMTKPVELFRSQINCIPSSVPFIFRQPSTDLAQEIRYWVLVHVGL